MEDQRYEPYGQCNIKDAKLNKIEASIKEDKRVVKNWNKLGRDAEGFGMSGRI